MMSLGYDEVARVCLTHSFNDQVMEDYIGKKDTTDAEYEQIQNALHEISMDEYDRLIQLCDAIAGADGVLDITERMADVRRRDGSYPTQKWNQNLLLKKYLKKKQEMRYILWWKRLPINRKYYR